MAELDASRGTVLWGFNHFRSEALVNLLNDLLALERVGLDEKNCEQVKLALGTIVNTATTIPDGSWLRGSIWKELQAFEDLYHRWNAHSEPGERSRTLKSMRKRRNRLAKRIRKNQYILSNELDLQLINNLYTALGDLSQSLPDLFKNLATSLKPFYKRWDS